MIFKKGKSCKASLNSQIKFQTIQCSSICLKVWSLDFISCMQLPLNFDLKILTFHDKVSKNIVVHS